MAWRRDAWNGSSFPPRSSPSALLNNLSTNKDSLCFVGSGKLRMLSRKSGSISTLGSGGSSGEVVEAKFVVLNGEDALVCCLRGGVEIWRADGSVRVFYCELDKVLEFTNDVDSQGAFCQGLATAADSSTLLVGTSEGDILQIQAELGLTDPKVSKVWLASLLKGHVRAIVDIAVASAGDAAASADVGGSITVWDAQALKKLFVLDGEGYPVTSLEMQGDSIIAAFSTGHIRLYRLSVRELSCEIVAHSRSITATSLHPSLNILATVSEDTYVSVWSLPEFNSSHPRAELLFHEQPGEGVLLTGVSFLDPAGTLMAVAYDTDHPFCWQRS